MARTATAVPLLTSHEIREQVFTIPAASFGTRRLWVITLQRGGVGETYTGDVVLMAIEAHGTTVLGVSDGTPPAAEHLYASAPNPFTTVTRIGFDLAREGRATLRIFDVTGRSVRTLVDERLRAQHHEVVWDGRDDGGAGVPNGVYLYELVAGGRRSSGRTMLLR